MTEAILHTNGYIQFYMESFVLSVRSHVLLQSMTTTSFLIISEIR